MQHECHHVLPLLSSDDDDDDDGYYHAAQTQLLDLSTDTRFE